MKFDGKINYLVKSIKVESPAGEGIILALRGDCELTDEKVEQLLGADVRKQLFAASSVDDEGNAVHSMDSAKVSDVSANHSVRLPESDLGPFVVQPKLLGVSWPKGKMAVFLALEIPIHTTKTETAGKIAFLQDTEIPIELSFAQAELPGMGEDSGVVIKRKNSNYGHGDTIVAGEA